MKKINYILNTFLFGILFINHLFGQNAVLRTITKVPSVAKETSGLLIENSNTIWTMNDSGGKNELYRFDTLGNLTRTLTINNATNVDWEEICTDAEGNVYVGDAGNNLHNRKNLRIYKIPNPSKIKTDTVSAAIINFSYEDQSAFPPSFSQWYYDDEAMFSLGDSLYICTKNSNYMTPYQGFTRVYRLPKVAGTYSAKFVTSISTDGSLYENGSATAAAISPDKSKVAILCYHKLFIFTNFTGNAFYKGNKKGIFIDSWTQKEAITFIDNCNVYISDELNSTSGGQLYALNVCKLLTTATEDITYKKAQVKVYPNPSSAEINFDFELPTNSILRIMNSEGKLLLYQKIEDEKGAITLPRHILPISGLYFYNFSTPDGQFLVGKFILD